MNECIYFDGKECRNMESTYYGSYGNFCTDCKNKKGDDTMKIKELKEKMLNANKTEKKEIIDLLIDEIFNCPPNGIGIAYYINDAFEYAQPSSYTYKGYRIETKRDTDMFIIIEIENYLFIFDWEHFVQFITNEGLIYIENILEKIEKILNNKRQAIKQQLKFIKKVKEEIYNLSEETNDMVWDLGPIETTLKVYEVLEKECQRIIYELNIDFDMSEYHITKGIPKAIKLIEKEIED